MTLKASGIFYCTRYFLVHSAELYFRIFSDHATQLGPLSTSLKLVAWHVGSVDASQTKPPQWKSSLRTGKMYVRHGCPTQRRPYIHKCSFNIKQHPCFTHNNVKVLHWTCDHKKVQKCWFHYHQHTYIILCASRHRMPPYFSYFFVLRHSVCITAPVVATAVQ